MIGILTALGLSTARAERLARPVLMIFVVLAIAAAVWVAIALTYRRGADAGGAKVEAEAIRQHADRVVEARTDERAAVAATAAIAGKAARAEALTDDYVRTTIEEIRDALDAVPPAVTGDALPAAPVERLRYQLNAGIDRANGAADAAGVAE